LAESKKFRYSGGQTIVKRQKLPSMQDSLFSDLSQVLPHLARLQEKIQTLRWLSKHIEESEVEMFVSFKDGTTFPLDFEIIPFNLQMEAKTLIEDSIDEYQRQHDNLQKLLNETNR